MGYGPKQGLEPLKAMDGMRMQLAAVKQRVQLLQEGTVTGEPAIWLLAGLHATLSRVRSHEPGLLDELATLLDALLEFKRPTFLQHTLAVERWSMAFKLVPSALAAMRRLMHPQPAVMATPELQKVLDRDWPVEMLPTLLEVAPDLDLTDEQLRRVQDQVSAANSPSPPTSAKLASLCLSNATSSPLEAQKHIALGWVLSSRQILKRIPLQDLSSACKPLEGVMKGSSVNLARLITETFRADLSSAQTDFVLLLLLTESTEESRSISLSCLVNLLKPMHTRPIIALASALGPVYEARLLEAALGWLEGGNLELATPILETLCEQGRQIVILEAILEGLETTTLKAERTAKYSNKLFTGREAEEALQGWLAGALEKDSQEEGLQILRGVLLQTTISPTFTRYLANLAREAAMWEAPKGPSLAIHILCYLLACKEEQQMGVNSPQVQAAAALKAILDLTSNEGHLHFYKSLTERLPELAYSHDSLNSLSPVLVTQLASYLSIDHPRGPLANFPPQSTTTFLELLNCGFVLLAATSEPLDRPAARQPVVQPLEVSGLSSQTPTPTPVHTDRPTSKPRDRLFQTPLGVSGIPSQTTSPEPLHREQNLKRNDLLEVMKNLVLQVMKVGTVFELLKRTGGVRKRKRGVLEGQGGSKRICTGSGEVYRVERSRDEEFGSDEQVNAVCQLLELILEGVILLSPASLSLPASAPLELLHMHTLLTAQVGTSRLLYLSPPSLLHLLHLISQTGAQVPPPVIASVVTAVKQNLDKVSHEEEILKVFENTVSLFKLITPSASELAGGSLGVVENLGGAEDLAIYPAAQALDAALTSAQALTSSQSPLTSPANKQTAQVICLELLAEVLNCNPTLNRVLTSAEQATAVSIAMELVGWEGEAELTPGGKVLVYFAVLLQMEVEGGAKPTVLDAYISVLDALAKQQGKGAVQLALEVVLFALEGVQEHQVSASKQFLNFASSHSPEDTSILLALKTLPPKSSPSKARPSAYLAFLSEVLDKSLPEDKVLKQVLQSLVTMCQQRDYMNGLLRLCKVALRRSAEITQGGVEGGEERGGHSPEERWEVISAASDLARVLEEVLARQRNSLDKDTVPGVYFELETFDLHLDLLLKTQAGKPAVKSASGRSISKSLLEKRSLDKPSKGAVIPVPRQPAKRQKPLEECMGCKEPQEPLKSCVPSKEPTKPIEGQPQKKGRARKDPLERGEAEGGASAGTSSSYQVKKKRKLMEQGKESGKCAKGRQQRKVTTGRGHCEDDIEVYKPRKRKLRKKDLVLTYNTFIDTVLVEEIDDPDWDGDDYSDLEDFIVSKPGKDYGNKALNMRKFLASHGIQ